MPKPHAQEIDILAGIAAVAIPGAGHALRGRPRRAILIAIGVLGLTLQGLLIGGIDAIDSKEDRYWFIGQALVGPVVWGIDYAHQNAFKAYDLGPDTTSVALDQFQFLQPRTLYPGERRSVEDIRIVDRRTGAADVRSVPVIRPLPEGDTTPPPNRKGLARMNEVGTLSIAIAGMLNVIVFLDALIPARRDPKPKGTPA